MAEGLLTERPATGPNGRMPQRSVLRSRYDALLQRILSASHRSLSGQAIGVTSCAPGAGVSTVAFNIAVTAARAGIGPVLFVDTSVGRRPNHEAVPASRGPGLIDVAAGVAEPIDCVQGSSIDGLSFVAAGRDRSANELNLDPNSVSQALDQYRRHFTLLIVDLPAPTELNGTLELAGQLDGVLLVIEAERADSRDAVRITRQLAAANATIVGAVLNKHRQHVPSWLYRLL